MDESTGIAAVDVVATVVKALSLIAVLQAAGIALFIMLYRQHLVASLRAIVAFGLLTASVGAVLALVHQALGAARMAGEFSGMWDASLTSLNWYSSNGATAIIRAMGAITIAVALKRESKAGTSIGIAAVIASFTLTGHMATQSSRVLEAVLSLHVAIAAFWFGALPALLIVAKRESSVQAVAAFSAHATLLVPCLAIAGLAMAYVLLPNIAALATPYGIAIVVKANSFALLMGLAVLNKWRFVPAMQRGDSRAVAAFGRTVKVEYAVIVLVLSATALMTTLFSPE